MQLRQPHRRAPYLGDQSHDAVVRGSAVQSFHHISHRRRFCQQQASHRIIRGLLLEPMGEVHFEDGLCWHGACAGPGQSTHSQHDNHEQDDQSANAGESPDQNALHIPPFTCVRHAMSHPAKLAGQ